MGSGLPYKVGDEVEGLRPPQLGAIHAVASHFIARRDPAIVTMPTGTGKTAVLMLSPFISRARRALVITPSRPVRGQIVEGFGDVSLLKRLGCLPAHSPAPSVLEVQHRLKSVADWEALEAHDVVVATPFTTSPAAPGIAPPPPGLFDLLLIDEAHHSPAHTWSGLLTAFPESRKAMFTATPFREDRREIKGRLVYSYSLRQARADGVFSPVHFVPADLTDTPDHDTAVARVAERELLADRERGFNHYLMVRTDTKKRADELQAVYKRETDLRVWVIHSDHSYARVKDALAKLRANELDGIICVDMFGEGFDLPNLKIAAIHAPHRSLAVTLQFIGRFARTVGDSIGPAKFIAVPSDIEVERERLFHQSQQWEDLVVNLGAGRVEQEEQTREALATFEAEPAGPATEDLDISLYSLYPKFHAKVYDCPDGADLIRTVEFPGAFEVIYHRYSQELSTLVIITLESQQPRWTVATEFARSEYDLFVIHYHEASRLLFINASRKNDSIYEQIAGQLAASHRVLPLPVVNRVLAGVRRADFFNIGMRTNSEGPLRESYRTLTGPAAQGVLTATDGHMYHRGHVFGRCNFAEGETTLGFSSAAKVWSTSSGQIPDLVRWCQVLATRISGNLSTLTNSPLDLLSVGELIDQIPSAVLAADWPGEVYETPPDLRVDDGNGLVLTRSLLDCDLLVERGAQNATVVVVDTGSTGLRAGFVPGRMPMFIAEGGWDNRVHLESGHEQERLIDWLNANPLAMILQGGAILHGRHLIRPSGEPPAFAPARVIVPDWNALTVDIHNEAGLPTNGLQSIHDGLKQYLRSQHPLAAFYDHGTGEIGDFITLFEEPARLVLRVYHCKALPRGGNPRGQLEDLFEVCGQAIKSVKWLRRAEGVCERIRVRQQPAGARSFFVGSFDQLDRLVRQRTKPLQFEVGIVQPALSAAAIRDGVSAFLSGVDEALQRALGTPMVVLAST